MSLFTPVSSDSYARNCIQSITNMETMLSTIPDVSALSSSELTELDIKMTSENRKLLHNLNKLGDVDFSGTFSKLQVNMGTQIIKDDIVTALRAHFSDYTQTPWQDIITKYDWLNDGIFSSNSIFIQVDPTDATKIIDKCNDYAMYLLQALTDIILEETLVISNQIPTGNGFTTRIAHESRLVEDTTTGNPFDVPRWSVYDPAIWFHTQARSSGTYAITGSKAIHKTLSSKRTQVTTTVPGIQAPVISRKLLLFLNIDSLDYDQTVRNTWLSNTSLISKLVNLVEFRIKQWNKMNTPDDYLDDNLTSGYKRTKPLTVNKITIKSGKMGCTSKQIIDDIHESLHDPYNSSPTSTIKGQRSSYYGEDKLLHFPLVNILNIFSDMINYCLKNHTSGHPHYTAIQDMLTASEINTLFPPNGGGFQIDIAGTVASPFINANASNPLSSAPFSSEIIINGDILQNGTPFRHTTGSTTTVISNKGISYDVYAGGSGKKGPRIDKTPKGINDLFERKHHNTIKNKKQVSLEYDIVERDFKVTYSNKIDNDRFGRDKTLKLETLNFIKQLILNKTLNTYIKDMREPLPYTYNLFSLFNNTPIPTSYRLIDDNRIKLNFPSLNVPNYKLGLTNRSINKPSVYKSSRSKSINKITRKFSIPKRNRRPDLTVIPENDVEDEDDDEEITSTTSRSGGRGSGIGRYKLKRNKTKKHHRK